MRTVVQLRSRLDPAAVAGLAGKICSESDSSLLLQGDADVYKPTGEALLMVRRGLVSPDLLDVSLPILRELKSQTTNNRGKYSGQERINTVFADGVKSKNTYTGAISSAVIGYFDRQGGRYPYCRATVFTADQVAKWQAVLPLIERVARVFEETLPARYRKQLEFSTQAPAEFVIPGTPFTTVTVNNNVAPSGVHTDKGDYKAGFGCILAIRRGIYEGAHLVFPEWGCSADLQDGDLLFFNSHDWHGVTPFRNLQENATRITLVFYFREKMNRCKDSAAELENAKRVRGRL